MNAKILTMATLTASAVFAGGLDFNYIGGSTTVKDKSAATSGFEMVYDMSSDKTGFFGVIKARLKGGDNANTNIESNLGYQIGDVKEYGIAKLTVAGLAYDSYTAKAYTDDPKFYLLSYRAGVGYQKDNLLLDGLDAYAGVYYLKGLESAFDSTLGSTSNFSKPKGTEAEIGVSYRFTKSLSANVGYFYKKLSFEDTRDSSVSVSAFDIKESQIRAGLGFRF
ncbi:MAG: hypothetical protein PHE67_01245 [Campylobacterales bacterium]|nr:hypothetical protein [Campylobacterales bacterium]